MNPPRQPPPVRWRDEPVVQPESVIIAGYAALLLAGALGLHRLGKVNRISRVLAGHRRALGDDRSGLPDSDWPGSENRRLHTGIALVAAVAATVLPAVEMLRHHRSAELLVLAAIALAGVATIEHLRRAL
jgi:hypothetical protein